MSTDVPMPTKEGLEKALEFTKYLIGLSGAFIAFLTGTTFITRLEGTADRVVVTGAVVLFAISAASGLAVWARGCTMMSRAEYSLSDSHMAIPGMVNVVTFGLAALCLGGLVSYKLIWQEAVTQASDVTCSGALICIGF